VVGGGINAGEFHAAVALYLPRFLGRSSLRNAVDVPDTSSLPAVSDGHRPMGAATPDARPPLSDYLRRRRRAKIPNPAITIIPTLAGSGTFARLMPLATAKASRAATSPADAAPLSPWLKFAANSLKSAALTTPS
jgi:hypothetical protein